MKCFLPIFLLLAAWPAFSAPRPLTVPVGTNETIITFENGCSYNVTNAVYRGNVHLTDPQMELMCELLTFNIETNNDTVNFILAETNVVIIQNDTWAIGDKAVYNLTNDIIELTGNVLLDHPRGWMMGTNAIYDRKNGNFEMPGKAIMGGSALSSTNTSFIPQLGGKSAVKPQKP